MAVVIFGVVAVIALIAVAIGLHVFVPPRRPAAAETPVEHAPMAPLHKHAWWSLVVGAAIALVMLAVVSIEGPTSFDESKTARLSITGLFAGALVTYAVTLLVVLRGADERDREIVNRAPAVQLVAALVTVAVWAIVLTKVYADDGSVPIVFPNLIFWSTFIVSVLARSAGILLGYAGWRGVPAEWL